jgi:hypothetical protein
MDTGELMPLPVFWARNGLCKTSFYYIERLGRGPETISLGTKKMVSSDAEAAWRKALVERPLKGSLRRLALAFEAAAHDSAP